MKKKIIIGIVIAIILILLVPIRMKLKDGGSVEYKAVLYTITKYHKIDLNSETGYIDGVGIKILGKEVYNNTKQKENNQPVEKKQTNGEIKPEETKVSKLSQMYIDMIDDLIEKDTGLQGNIKFISIDFTNFRRPLTEMEKAEKYNMPNFSTKEEKEEWERKIKSKPIEDETKQEIVQYLKEKYPNLEIKQNTYAELEKQGLAIKDQGIENGIIIYVSQIPEIITEDKAEINLTKYRGPLGAIFNEYEMKYKNDKWQLKLISTAIS